MERETHYYNQASENPTVKAKWWSASIPSEERYHHIWAVVKNICEKQSYRSSGNVRYAQLYHNMPILGLDAGMYSRLPSRDLFLANRVTLNVIKSCVDTAGSKIAKNKPRPMVLTEKGDWQQARRAQNLTQFLDGWFDSTKTYEKGRLVFRDGAVFGIGALKLFHGPNGVETERVISEEIIVDDVEGMYCDPRQLHQKKNVFREVLADLYPEHRTKIYQATSCIRPEHVATSVADMITVVESWHRPSGPDSSDGRHSISIDNCTLSDNEYEKDYFPFCFWRWSHALLGFYGVGIAEELIGIQLEINKVLRNIQIAQHLCAVPQVWLNKANQANKSHINNEIGGIKYYVDSPPIFMTPTAMNPETYNYLEMLYNRAFEITGISAMAAQAQKPPGITAAIALETLSDMQSERFMTVGQDWEDFYLHIADMAIDMTRDLYADAEVDVEVPVAGKDFMRRLHWQDVDMPRDEYVMRIFPTNILPTQPAGRLQKIQDLMQAGMFDREDAMALLDYPDLKAVSSRITSTRDDILRIVEVMLDQGRYISPEPYMNLQMAQAVMQGEYNKAKVDDAPESCLELMQRFMDDCQAMMERARAATIAQQEQIGAARPSSPEDVLPQVEQPSLGVEAGQLPGGAVPELPPEGALLPEMGETL